MLKKLQKRIEDLFATADGPARRPVISRNRESSVPGLYIIGDLAGAPVIKLAMEQGYDVIEHIASRPGAASGDPETLDLLIVGAGAAGLNAALAAKDRGLRAVVLEKEKIANTIENFPEGKWVYAEPDTVPPKGKLWLDGARKEDLVRRWHRIIEENGLDVRAGEGVASIRKEKGVFHAETARGAYRAHRVVLATGQRGNPRKLGVPGEDQEHVYHSLYSPRKYEDEDILVVGGGNSAVEAALTLSERNRVVLSYRGGEFTRIFRDNRRKLGEAAAAGRVKVVFDSEVTAFEGKKARLRVKRDGGEEEREAGADHAFVLIGAEPPVRFLKSIGIRMENEWEGSLLRAALLALFTLAGLWFLGGRTGIFPNGGDSWIQWAGGAAAAAAFIGLIFNGWRVDRWSWLAVSFLVWYTIYGVKVGAGREYWPYNGWGFEALSFAGRPWSFWYTVLYTALMTIFGIEALKRWGLDRKDRFQIWRFISLIGFQWIFFFLVPEFLFQWAVKYQWVGQQLAENPQFAEQAWRSYGIVYAWPLFFYTFFHDPHQIWIVWGILLAFIIIPVFVLFHGKRYCSWVCGCGGLAETFGDRWRHLAPKGRRSIQWEVMGTVILVIATAITVLVLLKDIMGLLRGAADPSLQAYSIIVDVWLVGIIPVTLYPFLGGKIWCRYWCPLARMMQLVSKLFVRMDVSRFRIYSNDKCIACYECSRNCLVGIDVMSHALKQEVLDNGNESCIGCGICVTVCPMDVLSFTPGDGHRSFSDQS